MKRLVKFAFLLPLPLLLLLSSFLALTRPAQADTVIRAARFSSPTATGTADFTISGIGTPKGYIVEASYAETNATAADAACYGIGFSDGTLQRTASFHSEHNLSIARTRMSSDTDEVIQLRTGSAGTLQWEAAHDSFITDGVRLNFTTVQGTAILLDITFIVGTDVSWYVNDFSNSSTLDAESTITDPGFTPDLLGVFGIDNTSITAINDTTASFSYGVASLGTGFPQGSLCYREVFNTADGDPRAIFEDRYAGQTIPTSSQGTSIEITGTDVNGFKVTTRVTGTAHAWGYWALKVGSSLGSDVITYASPTGTPPVSQSVTGFGFKPQYAGAILSHLVAYQTYKDDAEAGAFSTSVMDATRQNALALAIEDASATTDTQSYSENVPIVVPQHDGSAGLRATFTGFTSSGLDLSYTAVLGSARKGLLWAIEEEGAPPAAKRQGLINFPITY